MACHAPPLEKAKQQGEMPLPILSGRGVRHSPFIRDDCELAMAPCSAYDMSRKLHPHWHFRSVMFSGFMFCNVATL